MKRNCVNCGAPIDIDVDRCLCCKILYFNMDTTDFNHGEPVVLKIQQGDIKINQLVRPVLENMVFRSVNSHSPSFEANVRFEEVPFPNKKHL